MTFLLFFECVCFVCLFWLTGCCQVTEGKIGPASIFGRLPVHTFFICLEAGLSSMSSLCMYKQTVTFHPRYQLLDNFACENKVYRERKGENLYHELYR